MQRLTHAFSILLVSGLVAASAWGQTSAESAAADAVSGDPVRAKSGTAYLREEGPAGLAPLIAYLDDETAQSAHTAGVLLKRITLALGGDETREDAAAALVEGLASVSSMHAKRTLLGLLGAIGGGASVPAIAPYLSDATLMDDARMALQQIPGDAAQAALTNALQDAPEERLFLLMEGLAERGDEEAIPALRKFLSTDSPSIQWAAMSALARLGVPPYQCFDLTPQSNPHETRLYLNGIIDAAFHSLDNEEFKKAGAIFAYAGSFGVAPHAQIASILGMGKAGAETFPRYAIGALNTPEVRTALIRFLSEEGDDDLVNNLRRAYDVVDESRKVAILKILHAREHPSAPELLEQAKQGESPGLRFAALRLLNEEPSVDDLKAVVENGLAEQRLAVANLLTERSVAHAEAGDLDSARMIDEFLAGAPVDTAYRTAAVERLAETGSLDTVLVMYELRAASKAIVESLREAQGRTPTGVTQIEISNLESGDTSTALVTGGPKVDVSREDVRIVGRAALDDDFRWAVEKTYFTLLAKFDDPAVVRDEVNAALADTNDEAHRAYYQEVLNALDGE